MGAEVMGTQAAGALATMLFSMLNRINSALAR